MRPLIIILALLALGADAKSRNPKKPKPAKEPVSSGVYDLTLRMPDESKGITEDTKWDAGKTKDVVLPNVTIDMSKHCQWFTYNGKPARWDDEEFVVVTAVKK